MLKHEECLPIERLREMFDLNYETGQLTWRERPLHHFCHDKEKRRWNTRYAGKDICRTSGAKDDAWTYLTVNINATKFWAHRIVWALVHGHWPDGTIDHIDGDTLNNRPGNLRDVPEVYNFRNQKLRATNTSGVMGVTWSKIRSRWVARINDGKERRFLGKFERFDDAVAARKAAEIQLGYHENHGR